MTYRFNIFHPNFEVDYHNDFHSLREYIPQVLDIVATIKDNGASAAWYFFEPHLEITYNCHEQDSDFIRRQTIAHINYEFPDSRIEYKEGELQDWYCQNEEEREFGGRRHEICTNWIRNYMMHENAVNSGKGLRKQVERTIHTLCNPLGLNYKEEAKICFSRGLICLLFWLWPRRAIWIYTKVFRQKYW